MEILIGIVALIFVSIVMVAIGERLGLPWPTLLTVVIAGAIFVPGLPSLDVPSDMILPIFLPPLLWALARRTSWAVIRSQLSTVISLSVLLVVATIAAVTGTLMLMYPTLGVAAAAVIGAALAPPDPVAVDAVAETTVVPRRLTSALQMEGLFNDAASIVAFHVALVALLAGGDLSIAQGVWDFVVSVAVAVLIGVLGGLGAAKMSNMMDSTTARTAFSWIVPFAVYIVAEELYASGVIAIVIAAVEMNSRLNIGAECRSGGAFVRVQSRGGGGGRGWRRTDDRRHDHRRTGADPGGEGAFVLCPTPCSNRLNDSIFPNRILYPAPTNSREQNRDDYLDQGRPELVLFQPRMRHERDHGHVTQIDAVGTLGQPGAQVLLAQRGRNNQHGNQRMDHGRQ